MKGSVLVLLLLCVPQCSQASCNTVHLSAGMLHVTCTNISLRELAKSPTLLFESPADEVVELIILGILEDGIEADTFSAFTNLVTLQIRANITNIERASFSGLPALERLTLGDTKISTISVGIFNGYSGDYAALDLSLDNDVPLSININLKAVLESLSDLSVKSFVYCDCHIIWFQDVLDMFFYAPGDVQCFSELVHLNGTDLKFAESSELNSTCQGICNTTLNECDEHATCFSTSMDTFTCSCNPGFEGDGFTCNNVNECLSVSCPIGSTCMDAFGNYSCVPITCGGNEVLVGNTCECAGSLVRNEAGDDCECPIGTIEEQGNCTCEDYNRTLNGTSCICKNSLVEDAKGDCGCPDGLVFFPISGSCLCESNHMFYNSTIGECQCVGNRTLNGTNCICKNNLVEDAKGDCGCPDGLVFFPISGSCLCESSHMFYNSTISECQCVGNRILNGSNCVCADGFVEDSKKMECKHFCAEDMIYSPVLQTCVCKYREMQYDSSLERCVCQGNKTFNELESGCICRDNLVTGSDTSECECPLGLVYSLDMLNCTCPVGLEYVGSSPSDSSPCQCMDPVAYFVNGSIGCVCYSGAVKGADDLCECSEGLVPGGTNSCVTEVMSLLIKLNSSNLNASDIISINVAALASAMEDGAMLSTVDLNSLVSIIGNTAGFLEDISGSDDIEEAVQSLVNLTSYLLDEELEEAWANVDDPAGEVNVILTSIEAATAALVELANNSDTGILTIETEHIVLQVALPGKNPNGNDWMTIQTDISTVTLPASILNLTMCDIAILSGSFNGLHRILPIDDGVRNMSTNEPTRILSNLCSARDERVSVEDKINSAVISVNIISTSDDCHVNTSSLLEPVSISLSHLDTKLQSPVCISSSNPEGITWNTGGCSPSTVTDGNTECSCTHLTSFAILMHPSPIEVTLRGLNIASKVGLSISIICLLITVFVLYLVKVKNDVIKVHRQLALSLMLTEIVFLIGVDRQAVPSPDWLCTTFSAILHYLLLVTFLWMLFEGIHMFLLLVIVFYSKKIIFLYYAIAWGTPSVLVAITLLTSFCDYGTPQFCWVSSPGLLWGGVLGPIVVVLSINLVILILVTVIVIRARRKKSDNTNAVVVSLRTALILFPILGLSWVLGFFIAGDNVEYIEAIEWIFFIFVTLQGVMLFFLYCIYNREVREAVIKKFQKKYKSSRLGQYRNMRRGSTMESFKESFRRKVSVGSLKNSKHVGDITQLSLQNSEERFTVAKPCTEGFTSPFYNDAIEEEEDEGSNISHEDYNLHCSNDTFIDPATGIPEADDSL